MHDTWVQSLGQEDLLEKGVATHSSILAWRISWTVEPGRLQSMELQRVRQDWATNTFTEEFQSWSPGWAVSGTYRQVPCALCALPISFLISLGTVQISFQKPPGKSLWGKHLFVKPELSRLIINIHSTQFLFFLFNLPKRPSWEGLGAGGKGNARGWDGWMASPTRWMWVWVNSGRWWWTGRPGMLQFKGLQSVGRDWATELNWKDLDITLPTKVHLVKAMVFQ